MAQHKDVAIEGTAYFHFAANDTSGSGGDGATPVCDVRLCGAAADAAPVLSPTPELLSDAGYPDGCHEVAIDATEANGFAAGNEYAVFCALTVDSQDPTGFVGTLRVTAASDTLHDGAARVMDALPNAAPDAAGGLPVSDAGGLDMDAMAADVAGLDGDAMRGTDGAAVAGDEMTLEDGAITDATLAADTDTYQAKVTLIDDNTGTADRYIVVFYKNSQPIVTGITTPTIQVVQLDDGEDLIEATALAQVDTTGMYQLTDGARTTAGASYMAIVKGTIAGSERSWYQPIGRDSV